MLQDAGKLDLAVDKDEATEGVVRRKKPPPKKVKRIMPLSEYNMIWWNRNPSKKRKNR